MSLAVVVLGIWLSLHEWNVVFNNELKSEIVFDNLHMQDLQVNLDIGVYNVPCEIVDLKFTSKKGKPHTVHRFDETKEQLRAAFSNAGTEYVAGATPEEVAKKIENGVGCRIRGTFYMHFLANHFTVGYGNHMLLSKVARIMKIEKHDFVMDLSHKITEVTFGKPSNKEANMKK